eukprot:605489-Rhodomonas_salina.1
MHTRRSNHSSSTSKHANTASVPRLLTCPLAFAFGGAVRPVGGGQTATVHLSVLRSCARRVARSSSSESHAAFRAKRSQLRESVREHRRSKDERRDAGT